MLAVIRRRRAFTLVEILIVVVILGILAAIVVPQFANATGQAQETSTKEQLNRIRKALAIYYVRAGNVYPSITAGNGTWGELLTTTPPYFAQPPANMWVGGANARTIIIRNSADTAFQTTYGWIWDPTSGQVWAGGYDASDAAFPRP
ncbi:MAG: type II secretion system protein [Planctomycetota bacterium]|nr:type II secretion system protein [Planctomycetota bacterium]